MDKTYATRNAVQEVHKIRLPLREVLTRTLRTLAATTAICLQAHSALGASQNNNPSADFSVHTLNWSGYVSEISGVLAQSVIGVNGTFNVPKISLGCFTHDNSPYGAERYEVAAWIGIGGAAENSLVQTGVIAQEVVFSLPKFAYETSAQKFSYKHISPFYEMLPNPPVRVQGLDIHQGDKVSASISKSSGTSSDFTISIIDSTNGKSFKKTVAYPISQAYPLPHLSAEWVVERPAHELAANTFFNMPLFSTVRFVSSGMEVNYLGISGMSQYPIKSLGELIRMDMSKDGTSSSALTHTSGLLDGGSNFDVTQSKCVHKE